MAFGLKTAEKITGEGGNFADKPGTYHLMVIEPRENESGGKNSKPIDGFSVEFDVLAGTEPDQVGKKMNLTFWSPNFQKDSVGQQEMAVKQQTAYLIATNLLAPSDLGKEGTFDLEQSRGQQVIATVERSKKKDDKGKLVETEFLRLVYARIFHIDDPDAANFPKDAASLKHIEAKDRRPPEYFAFKAAAAPQTPPAAPPSASEMDEGLF